MFNSTFKNSGKGLKRSAPMKQTGFTRKTDGGTFRRAGPLVATLKKSQQNASLRNFAISQVSDPKQCGNLRASRPKTSKIRQSAAKETCRLRLPGICKVEPGNVVWAHSNRGEHGKAAGLKANDEWGAYACYWCHCIYDRQHPRPDGMTLAFVETEFTRAMHESRAALAKKGLITAPATKEL